MHAITADRSFYRNSDPAHRGGTGDSTAGETTRRFRQLAHKLEREVMQFAAHAPRVSCAGDVFGAAQEGTSNDAITACYVRGYN